MRCVRTCRKRGTNRPWNQCEINVRKKKKLWLKRCAGVKIHFKRWYGWENLKASTLTFDALHCFLTILLVWKFIGFLKYFLMLLVTAEIQVLCLLYNIWPCPYWFEFVFPDFCICFNWVTRHLPSALNETKSRKLRKPT